jgi:hypothetical protein
MTNKITYRRAGVKFPKFNVLALCGENIQVGGTPGNAVGRVGFEIEEGNRFTGGEIPRDEASIPTDAATFVSSALK